ncbi:PEP-CTERM sorting domain-containing protein, partial [Akkermansiaceae bacterium]|nr:PEP-CTERM sorting domain-containing protein [Akkermansiaceae bacterium]
QIKNIRLDPIGGAATNSNSETNGNFFAVDFIQVNDTSIPEPSSALLSLLAGGLLFSRRRK